MINAIIWDFGGVFTSSPFEAFNALEAERGLPRDFIRTLNATNPDTNAWAQFESARISAAEFDALFLEESGGRVRGRDVMDCIYGRLRPRMVAALDALKAAGMRNGLITNNVASDRPKALELDAVFARFDHVIESSKAGIRKPDPRIYALMCEALDVEPAHCVFLDDLGVNLKPARAMGMATIKVLSEDQALADLAALTGLSLQ
ncbi:MAG: HAD-IA family hydrolase [Hydrogenophilaceae bacterium]|jgi:putative hydrolase of the HAD superfamily|nr:HAD-IA family hydrolase [Hydrogenophilaceae bacterium]